MQGDMEKLEFLKIIFCEDGFYAECDRGSLNGCRGEKQGRGRQIPESDVQVPEPDVQLQEALAWQRRFEKDRNGTFYQFGLEVAPGQVSSSAAYLYHVAELFFQALLDIPELELVRGGVKVKLTAELEQQLLQAVPFVLGAESITPKWLKARFKELNSVFSQEIGAFEGTVEQYMAEKSQRLRVPERVFFHLVENKGNEDFPFAFLATYATKQGRGKVRHVPLQYALTEYANDRGKLLALLSCLNKAAERSSLIAGFMASGEMFHPLGMTAEEAYEFLKEIPAIEEAGILCRIPNWWRKKAAFVSLSVSLGDEKPALLGADSLISMRPSLMVDGMLLTEEDVRALLQQTEGLAFIKGKWIEVDHGKLKALLAEMERYRGAVSLRDALGMQLSVSAKEHDKPQGPQITNGAWLTELLQHLRRPSAVRSLMVPRSFQAVLRKYQKTGYTWLDYMDQLGFGACLADDMGLGKTVQVLAYLERLRRRLEEGHENGKALLVVPTSLLGNWKKEIARFAPQMDVQVLHGKSAAVLESCLHENMPFLTITTYGMTVRMETLKKYQWRCLILDEAQAIKNPGTKQTRQIKAIPARMRIAMTGTPIENDLSNLWSLFDFLNRGLLGTAKEFQQFNHSLTENPEGYQQLKRMVSPFILRRVKTDRSIISDLPDKLETTDYVNLSKKQVVLYRRQVEELERRLAETEGIERCGLVLSAITRLKQICNHPDQFLGQQVYAPEESGKFEMLRELCESIADRHERVLVFTQYKEITGYLASFLENVFHRPGLVLHGSIPAARRSELVEAFNGQSYVPFMVLSVKAGGTGLNLTAANHVIHFDRWWNPAVENQATDRVYRIGQKKNVLVHKLVCEKTVEERIDMLLQSKRDLAGQVIGEGSGEKWITELGNDELMAMLRLG